MKDKFNTYFSFAFDATSAISEIENDCVRNADCSTTSVLSVCCA